MRHRSLPATGTPMAIAGSAAAVMSHRSDRCRTVRPRRDPARTGPVAAGEPDLHAADHTVRRRSRRRPGRRARLGLGARRHVGDRAAPHHVVADHACVERSHRRAPRRGRVGRGPMRPRRCAAADRRGSPGPSRPTRWASARRRRPWARPARTPRRRRRPYGRQSRGQPRPPHHGLRGRRRGRRRSRTCRSRQSTRRARRSNVTRYLATVSRPPGGGSGSSPRWVRTVATSTRPRSTARVTCSARMSVGWSSHPDNGVAGSADLGSSVEPPLQPAGTMAVTTVASMAVASTKDRRWARRRISALLPQG